MIIDLPSSRQSTKHTLCESEEKKPFGFPSQAVSVPHFSKTQDYTASSNPCQAKGAGSPRIRPVSSLFRYPRPERSIPARAHAAGFPNTARKSLFSRLTFTSLLTTMVSMCPETVSSPLLSRPDSEEAKNLKHDYLKFLKFFPDRRFIRATGGKETGLTYFFLSHYHFMEAYR